MSERPTSTAEQVRGVLAIDGGNSKTDVALVALDGTVLGAARGDGFEPHRDGPDRAIEKLAPLVEAVAEQAGLRPDRLLTTRLSACMANVDLPVEEQRLHAAVAARPWAVSASVGNDTFGLLRAGTDSPRGVAVVCGAGINCVGLLPDGRTARFPALGKLTGDWGGGGGMAAEAMWHAARAEDGRGQPTALSAAIGRHFGLAGANAVAEAIHLGRLPRRRLHEIVRLLFATAQEGDATALRLIDRQADEITRLAVVALRRLRLLDEPTPVVLGGGVLAAKQPLLIDNLTARLAAAAPLAEPRIVVAPPVLGAALLGLDHLEADRTAYDTLRAAYPTTEQDDAAALSTE
ncbi:N-acetylglucosamine kinase [Nocardia pseudobrasiliensis]|uniref:N-acetylglucosamine kinase-like BadF-type ATPase n=1 Tax=Nocardia pseudobrasiliensis TaxID=45979 RepID=A0A370HYU2_9NOCA|nr:BadF/BadG/BcrA/BcrD ATPase family protein [Nocardia pseudobrasiliensis]RDI63673.1 N-acetylglucosamine kinase-like BadF-type ATPase [Nocardia pseudobrasiliensis]